MLIDNTTLLIIILLQEQTISVLKNLLEKKINETQASKSTKMTIKRLLVGGPILGDKETHIPPSESPKTFDPLVTPLIGIPSSATSTSDLQKPERFVLLPHTDFIQVLAYKTGRIVANFLPFSSKDISKNKAFSLRIESVCLAKYPAKPRNVLDVLDHLSDSNKKENKGIDDDYENCSDHVVLVGCNDGTLREFSLLVLLPTARKLRKKYTTSGECGSWELPGHCFGPRRVFQVSKHHPLKHITAPACTIPAEYGLLLYTLTEDHSSSDTKEEGKGDNEKGKHKKKDISATMIRVLLPPYFGDSLMEDKDTINLIADKEDSPRVATIDIISCKDGKDKKGNAFSNLPFHLDAVVRARTQDLLSPSHESLFQQTVFVVVARSTSIMVYCEQLSDIGLEETSKQKRKFAPVSFSVSSKNRLCSISVSTNKNDIACGHMKGDIVIKGNLLALVEEYISAQVKYEKQRGSSGKDGSGSAPLVRSKPKHPSNAVIDANVHWHAHPVTSLCYDRTSPASDPILYSGGNESVLVTWQLSRGITRPADVLPRIALGGILSILCTTPVEGGYDANDGILVYCEDNSLQLFERHNKASLWKIKGLATRKLDTTNDHIPSPSVTMDPKRGRASSSQLMLNGIPGAPGLIQWYDPREQRVTGQLEIAPYNRVSRMDQNDETPMPAPVVTHYAMSSVGNDLVTIDEVPTENKFVGGVDDTEAGFGVLTTIRFWCWNPSVRFHKSSPYDPVAVMIHPHGNGQKLSAVTLSSDGQYACTVSNDEKAFRLWQKVLQTSDEDGFAQKSDGRRMPVWICQYRITTPSGYSNFPTGKSGVAFSPDSSILAISYGSKITIWDHHDMTLLTCLHHLDDDAIVDSVEFTKQEMIFAKSSTGVSLQSPFGDKCSSNSGWSWTVADVTEQVKISCAQIISSQNCVAVSIYYESYDISRIVFLDMLSGEPLKSQDGILIENISGAVCSIGQSEKLRNKSNWHDVDGNAEILEHRKLDEVGLYALTNHGVLVALKEDMEDSSPLAETNVATIGSMMSNVPKLSTTMGGRGEPAKKRQRLGVEKFSQHSDDKKLSMAYFGSILEDSGSAVPMPTEELPILSGGFARAFVGRNLLRN